MRDRAHPMQYTVLWLGCLLFPFAHAQTPDTSTQELLRQRERERVLREQLETRPDARLPDFVQALPDRLPQNETPCFPIARIELQGEDAARFRWALDAANPKDDPANGQCLGAGGINLTMARVQNALMARGFVTTRVLAQAQDLHSGTLILTLLPGRIHAIRFADGTSARARAWSGVRHHE